MERYNESSDVRQLFLHGQESNVVTYNISRINMILHGVPVWEHAGMICTGETYKSAVKLTFAKGASLEDPSGLFNSSLEGSTRRAIDIHEGEAIDEAAFQKLIVAAVALNTSRKKA